MSLIEENLKRLQLANDYTQGDVADMMHISVPAYSNMETGKTNLNFSRLKQLAAVYKITFIQLLSSPGPALPVGVLEMLNAKILQKQLEINFLRLRLIELHHTLKLV